MHVCPHCQAESISSLQKVFSVSFAPVICPNCKGRSYVHVLYGLLAMTTWIVLTWLFIGLSYMSRSSIFLLGSVPAAVVAVNKFMINAPLVPIRSP